MYSYVGFNITLYYFDGWSTNLTSDMLLLFYMKLVKFKKVWLRTKAKHTYLFVVGGSISRIKHKYNVLLDTPDDAKNPYRSFVMCFQEHKHHTGQIAWSIEHELWSMACSISCYHNQVSWLYLINWTLSRSICIHCVFTKHAKVVFEVDTCGVVKNFLNHIYLMLKYSENHF
jgi:hypothetical protein